MLKNEVENIQHFLTTLFVEKDVYNIRKRNPC